MKIINTTPHPITMQNQSGGGAGRKPEAGQRRRKRAVNLTDIVLIVSAALSEPSGAGGICFNQNKNQAGILLPEKEAEGEMDLQRAINLLDEADRWGGAQGKSWIQYVGLKDAKAIVKTLQENEVSKEQLTELIEILEFEEDSTLQDVIDWMKEVIEQYEEWLEERANRQ